MIAFVLAESAASSWLTSILYVGSVTSTNTGTSRFWIIGFTRRRKARRHGDHFVARL